MSEPRPPTPIEAWLTVPLAFSVSRRQHLDHRAGGQPVRHVHLGPAREVLAEVEHPGPGLRVGDPRRRPRPLHLHRLGGPRRELGGEVGRGDEAGAAPVHRAPVAPRRGGAQVTRVDRLAAGVVVRAAEPVVGDGRTEGGAPVAVGDDRLGRAVGVGDLEAADQPRRDLRAGARVERGDRVAGAGDERAGRVRARERGREGDARARRGDRRARRVRAIEAPTTSVSARAGVDDGGVQRVRRVERGREGHAGAVVADGGAVGRGRGERLGQGEAGAVRALRADGRDARGLAADR